MSRARAEAEKNINNVMVKTAKLSVSIFCGLFLLLGFQGHAQQVFEEPDIKVLKNYFRSYYSQQETIRGYRIQISSSTDRRQMERDLDRFKLIYPDMFNEWKHNAPYYRIIVGAFLTKKEAQEKIHSMRNDFSGCILVFDDITKDELLH